MGVALSLPRAAAVTDELLSPVPEVAASGLRAVGEGLVGALAPLAAEIPPGARLVLDGYRFSTARRRPDRCAQPERAFVPTATACRRGVGLAALARCARRRAAGPMQAVAEVLASEVEDLGRSGSGETPRAAWWAPWYATLGEGGRAAVAAEAVTWATQLWTALDWERLGPVVVGRDDWWDLPTTRALALKGRAEIRARVGSRAVLVVVSPGVPDALARADLVFPALVALLAGGSRGVPARVLGIWPASGQVRVVPVDADALRRCAEEVVAAAGTWVDALLEQQARR